MEAGTKPSGAQRLTRERILAAALALVDRDGPGALSMRRLAQELDVWPMSIYRHFADKDALLDAMAGSAAGEVELPAKGAAWRTEMEALLVEARRALGPDAGGLASRLPRALLTDGGLRIAEAGLSILARAGIPPRDAAGAWRALLSYTFGFAMVAVAPDPDEAVRSTRAAIAGLSERDHPALFAARDELASALAEEDEFACGLALLLDGVDLLRTASSPSGTQPPPA
jgi:AcrR family transcriptional regulator